MGRRKRPVKCVETGKEYESIIAAAKDMHCDIHLIWKALNGWNKTSMGYRWEYL